MIFNGIEKDYVSVLEGRKRPFFEKDNERIVEVPILMKHNGFSDYQKRKEDVAEWLIHDEPKELIFNDDDDRRYFAEVDDIVEDDEYQTMAMATVIFICHSKYSLEKDISIDTTATETIGGHKSTPWKTKTTFEENQSGYELQFNSPGKSDLRDTCKIKLNYEFIRGDVLEIDYSKRKITVNGVDRSNILVILQSNYMELPVGEVEFEVSHETELFYSERYY